MCDEGLAARNAISEVRAAKLLEEWLKWLSDWANGGEPMLSPAEKTRLYLEGK